MRFLLNLSFRYKVPLWGSLLIVATATIISSTLLLRSYGELKNDLLRDARRQPADRGKALGMDHPALDLRFLAQLLQRAVVGVV